MKVSRIVIAALSLVIFGQAWALVTIIGKCDERSGAKALATGVQSLLNQGNVLRVPDKEKFAADLSGQGITCRYSPLQYLPIGKDGVVFCHEGMASGMPSIVHRSAEFKFEEGVLQEVWKGFKK